MKLIVLGGARRDDSSSAGRRAESRGNVDREQARWRDQYERGSGTGTDPRPCGEVGPRCWVLGDLWVKGNSPPNRLCCCDSQRQCDSQHKRNWLTLGEGDLLTMCQNIILQGERPFVERYDVKHGSETCSGLARRIGTRSV